MIALLQAMTLKHPGEDVPENEAQFRAEQNALIVKNAERYYRAMVKGGSSSWNVRDRHMMETLDRLMRFYGSKAKAVIWEHNTHIGDARATDMAGAGMVNVGQLTREAYQEEGVYIVGFSGYEGTVIAGEEWDAPMSRMPVPPGRSGSWEHVFHEATEGEDALFFSDELTGEEANEPRGHRAIGVVYHPEYEHYGNYVPTVMPHRYDAVLFLDQTRALHPLRLTPHDHGEPPETYPWNV